MLLTLFWLLDGAPGGGRFRNDGRGRPLSTEEQSVPVDELQVAHVVWAQAPAVQDLHAAAAVKRVGPLAGSTKPTVPQQEVLTHVQTGALGLKSARAVLSIALVVVSADLSI